MKNMLYLLVTVFVCSHAHSQMTRLASPDKKTILEIGTDQNKKLQYRISFNNKQVTEWSALGFILNDVVAGESTIITGKKQSSHTEVFEWPLGENDHIQNNYTSLLLNCRSSMLSFFLETRVFNGSVTFRYQIPSQQGLNTGTLKQEKTEFNFFDNYNLYQYHQESVFNPVSIDTFNTSSDFPSTLSNSQLYLSIGETDNRNYTKAELKRGPRPHSLEVIFPRDSIVKTSGAFNTPWRTISMSTTAIGLHNFSELNLKLAAAGPQTVPSWIKPGKLIRAQLSTQSGIDCIDFASRHQLQYIMFDAGWYGAEVRSTSDPTQPIPQMDMPAIIQHGKEKGIGVILYVNYVGLRAKLDTILPLYKKWGVKGIKFGFVDGLTQDGLIWLAAAIKKTNDYGFILDIHDNYKPTGLSREFPALLTQEGIRGDENSPDAYHTTVLPFTRFIAGPADFTFCYPNEKNSYSKNLLVSKAQQLALTVIYFSPLQSMFWYGQPNDYTNEGEIEFFKLVPTVWNESRYLAGDIGRNISVARRKGTTWFIGNAAGLNDWKTNMALDFLDATKSYLATIYEDDGSGSILKRIITIKKGDAFPVLIKAKGGQAIIIAPVK